MIATLLLAPLAANAQVSQPIPVSPRGFVVEIGKSDTRITLTETGRGVIVDIVSPSGIDRATIRRPAGHWPPEVRIRLHLAGLERFKTDNQAVEIEWSVSSGPSSHTTTTLRTATGVSAIASDNPYWASVTLGGENAMPDRFEIALPTKLFEYNPPQIALSWVDFFR